MCNEMAKVGLENILGVNKGLSYCGPGVISMSQFGPGVISKPFEGPGVIS